MSATLLPNFDTQQRQGENGSDARRIRKAIFRRTIDYNAAVITYLKDRIWQRSPRSRPAIQPDYLYNYLLNPPSEYLDNPMNCVTGKPVRTSTNKNKCPIYCVCWTPEGRRLITGAYSGEFTLWNGLTFNFETILQAHDSQIRCMKWSHNDDWLLTADHSGYVKYWQANMNNVEMYQAHKEPIRGVSFSPFDTKFVTCSDDSTVRIWDFLRCTEERVLRGHGSDVRTVAWHPHMSLIISGSKDAQQPIKLWEPKTGESIVTLYVHKNTCTDVAWNKNGNWFLTASRDHLVKLFDLRYMKSELQTFRGHKRDVMRVAWHPCIEGLFASGSADGAILFWSAGTDTELGAIDDAHESMIWSLAWHPLGHILVSGANDFATKFWTRNRPGDILKDVLGTGSMSGASAIASEALVESDSVNRSAEDRVFDEVGSSLARALADAAGRLPIFESTELTIPIPPLPHSENVGGLFGIFDGDGMEQMRPVEIPGINEGFVSNANDGDRNLEEDQEKLKTRLTRLIPKEFMANWSATRNKPTQNIVLSAVAQNQKASLAASNISTAALNSSEPSFSTSDNTVSFSIATTSSEEGLPSTEISPSNVIAQSNLMTPAFSSDMHATFSSASAPAKFNSVVDEEARSATSKQLKKFDSAAREEDMLTFAKGLNVNLPNNNMPDPRAIILPQQPPPRFLKPMIAPRMQPPPPNMPHPPPPRPHMERFCDRPRFMGPQIGSRPPPPSPNIPMRRDYPVPPQEDGWKNYPPFPDQTKQRGGSWRMEGHPPERGFCEIPHRPQFRSPLPPSEPWVRPPRFLEDPGQYPPPPKRPTLVRNMSGPRPDPVYSREPWSEPPGKRGGWH